MMKCIACSTDEEEIIVEGELNADTGYIECEKCGSIELEEVDENGESFRIAEEMEVKADLERKYGEQNEN